MTNKQSCCEYEAPTFPPAKAAQRHRSFLRVMNVLTRRVGTARRALRKAGTALLRGMLGLHAPRVPTLGPQV